MVLNYIIDYHTFTPYSIFESAAYKADRIQFYVISKEHPVSGGGGVSGSRFK